MGIEKDGGREMKTAITDNDFTLRCCWMCKHCKLDLGKGYICIARSGLELFLGGNVEIHKDRTHCPDYVRG